MGGREELQIPFFSLFLAVIASILLRGREWLIGKTNPTLSRPSLVHDYFNCPRYLEERERQPTIFLPLLIAIFSNIHIFRRADNLGIICLLKINFLTQFVLIMVFYFPDLHKSSSPSNRPTPRPQKKVSFLPRSS